MEHLKRLIVEIHDRSLWQVLLLNLGDSRAALEVGETVAAAVRYSQSGSARPSKSKAGV